VAILIRICQDYDHFIQVKLSPNYLPPAVASFFIHSSLDLFIKDPEVEQTLLARSYPVFSNVEHE